MYPIVDCNEFLAHKSSHCGLPSWEIDCWRYEQKQGHPLEEDDNYPGRRQWGWVQDSDIEHQWWYVIKYSLQNYWKRLWIWEIKSIRNDSYVLGLRYLKDGHVICWGRQIWGNWEVEIIPQIVPSLPEIAVLMQVILTEVFTLWCWWQKKNALHGFIPSLTITGKI